MRIKIIYVIILLTLSEVSSYKLYAIPPKDKYSAKVIGNFEKDKKCKLIVVNKSKQKEVVEMKIKSFLICIKDKNGKPDDCYVMGGNEIDLVEYREMIFSNKPSGKYQIVFIDLLCGPSNDDNSDLNHFLLEELNLEFNK